MGVPLQLTLYFSLDAFRILSLSLTFAIFICHLPLGRSVWVQLVLNPLCFLYLDICFLLQSLETFSHNFFKYIFTPPLSFSSPLVSLLCIDWPSLYYPIDLLYCFLFFFIWLSVCYSDWVIFIILSSKSFSYPLHYSFSWPMPLAQLSFLEMIFLSFLGLLLLYGSL